MLPRLKVKTADGAKKRNAVRQLIMTTELSKNKVIAQLRHGLPLTDSATCDDYGM